MFKTIAFKTVAFLLKLQANRLLRKHKPIVVGITGSVGKTSTKLAVATVLSEKYKVQVHPGNYNSETGVPLALFEMESPGGVTNPAWLKVLWEMEKKINQPFNYEIVVLEFGATKDGDIEYFKFTKPDLGIVVAAKPAHLEFFNDMKTIQNEKFKLAEYSKRALVNAEDDLLMQKFKTLPKGHGETYGIHQGDYSFEVEKFDVNSGYDGMLNLKGERIPVHMNLYAPHIAAGAVAGAAAGKIYGLTDNQIKAGVEKTYHYNGRMNRLDGKNGSVLIDDSYNNNPEAAKAALNLLYSLPGRKIAILGGMNEMGKYEKKYHDEVGSQLGRLDLLVTVAGKGRLFVKEAKKAGLSDEQIKSFDSPNEAGEYVAGIVKKDDKILIKGSQGGIFTEEATKKLLANPEDESKLVRQSDFWFGVKRKSFAKGKGTSED